MDQGRASIARDRTLQGLLIALGTLALLWPALANGFPLVFMDTWWYLAPLFGQPAHVGRAAGYSGFEAMAMAVFPSLWSIVVAQAAITSLLLVRAAAAIFAGRLGWAALALVAVALLSGGAKYASWLMPDVLTAWLFLAGVLFLASSRRLDLALATGFGMLSLASHNVHLPLGLGVAAAAAAVAWVAVPHARKRALAAFGVAAVLGPAAAVVGSQLLDGRGEVLRGTSPFLANKFVDSGVMLRTLDRYCPERPWAACAHRDWFERSEGQRDDLFLFAEGSPFLEEMGAWVGDETPDIVRHAFRCCWAQIAATSVADTWEQLWRIDTSDGIDARRTVSIQKALESSPLVAGLAESRQARGLRVRLRVLELPEAGLQAILLAIGLGLSVLAWRHGERRPAWLFGAFFLFLCLNAAISSFASTTHDRYQGRAAWLLPWVIVVCAGLTARADPRATWWAVRGSNPAPSD